MAIVDSVAIGSARKSAGDLVYQHYYGRTIAHHKALKDATKKATDPQKLARTVFAYKIYVANQFKIIIDNAFARKAYGTKYSNFVSVNSPAIAEYYNIDHEEFEINVWDMLRIIERMKIAIDAKTVKSSFYSSFGDAGVTSMSVGRQTGTSVANCALQADALKKYTSMKAFYVWSRDNNEEWGFINKEAIQDDNYRITADFDLDISTAGLYLIMGYIVADGVPINGIAVVHRIEV